VNAAPPYIVNDLYKRFVNPEASQRTCMRMSYAASFGVVLLGVTFGWFVGSINDVIQWIVSALWGGYTASNVLKWYWWRFNGYGYFWGMATGIGAAMVIPTVLPHVSALNSFPIILGISLIGAIAATLSTAPEDPEVLKNFYKRVAPGASGAPSWTSCAKTTPPSSRIPTSSATCSTSSWASPGRPVWSPSRSTS